MVALEHEAMKSKMGLSGVSQNQDSTLKIQ